MSVYFKVYLGCILPFSVKNYVYVYVVHTTRFSRLIVDFITHKKAEGANCGIIPCTVFPSTFIERVTSSMPPNEYPWPKLCDASVQEKCWTCRFSTAVKLTIHLQRASTWAGFPTQHNCWERVCSMEPIKCDYTDDMYLYPLRAQWISIFFTVT